MTKYSLYLLIIGLLVNGSIFAMEKEQIALQEDRFTTLPSDVLEVKCKKLAVDDSSSAQHLRNLSRTNKRMYAVINDPRTTKTIISAYANGIRGNLLVAASELGTPGAKAWLRSAEAKQWFEQHQTEDILFSAQHHIYSLMRRRDSASTQQIKALFNFGGLLIQNLPLIAGVITSENAERFKDVKFLLSLQVNPNVMCGGETALHRAINVSDERTVAKLLYVGADPRILNDQGKSAYECACHHDYIAHIIRMHIHEKVIDAKKRSTPSRRRNRRK